MMCSWHKLENWHRDKMRDFLDICWKSQLAEIRISDKFLTCLTGDFISQKASRESKNKNCYFNFDLLLKKIGGIEEVENLRKRNNDILEFSLNMKERLGLY